VAFLFARNARDRLAEISRDPTAFLAAERALHHPGVIHNYYIAAIAIGFIVLLVDGVSGVLARVIPDRGRTEHPVQSHPIELGIPADVPTHTPLTTSIGTPRRPMIAGLLGICSGLGQLYAGDPGRAAAMWVGSVAASACLIYACTHFPGVSTFVLALTGLVTVQILIIRDAVLTARRALPNAPVRWYSRWPGLTLVGVVMGVAVSFVTQIEKRTIGQAYWLPSAGMAPGLIAGDWVFVVPADSGAATRGAIVVFDAWGAILVKRVVGLPGDTLSMRAGVITVNNRVLVEPYAVHDRETEAVTDTAFGWQRLYLVGSVSGASYHPTIATWGPLAVPVGKYFVLGDNRGNSLDSRYRGFIPGAAIKARPTGVYFSRDPFTGIIYWSRIGQLVR